jgi:ribosome recycling factor
VADEDLVIDETRQAMHKSLESLQRDMARVRTGRANPAILDGVSVDYYGTATPLKQLAAIHVADARLMTVQPFDPSALAEIERAILKADLGLSPVNDGKLLRVPIPELTEERRRELVKQVKKMGEEHKVGIRNARRDGISLLKDLEKESGLSEDDSHRAQEKVQAVTDEFVKKTETAVAAKEEEILRI